MFRFCLKAFAIGTAIAFVCYGLMSLTRSLGLFVLPMFVWPWGIWMIGDMPGIKPAGVALLLAISAVLNGLLYMGVGALGRFLYARANRQNSN
jgi:hypothetical protein